MFGLIAALGLAAVGIILGFQRQVVWSSFLVGILASLALIAVGAYARRARNAPCLALCAIGGGIFMGFTAFAALFIFALFPLTNPMIDLDLIRLDATLGYDWVAFVSFLAQFPTFTKLLGLLYHSSLFQILLTIVVLGVLGRETTLHRFLLTGILTMVTAVGVWWMWPSIGPSGFSVVPAAVQDATGLVYNSEYGAYLRFLVEHGPYVISRDVITGVVAFPSYHMIMACMVVWYNRTTPAFLPALAINSLMIPATLSHGGHHFVDLVAGVFVFLVIALMVKRLIPSRVI
jgi:hypothetical protein